MTIKTIGAHRIQHGDIQNGIDELMSGVKADILYSDPPWGGGNLKYWATYNKKTTGAETVPMEFEAFIGKFFGIAESYALKYLLVEYGQRWRDTIQARATGAGFVPHGIPETIYGATSQRLRLDLHLFARPGFFYPAGYAEEIQGTKGYDTVRKSVGPLVASLAAVGVAEPVILDPCCGMGYTAKAALEFGCRFRGNELNAARLAKTEARLRTKP